ncbi:MAG: tetratricopeptide repeat protein [Terracidiphilus sp.]
MMSKPTSAGVLLALMCFLPPAAQPQAGASDDAADRYATEGRQALAAGNYSEASTDFGQLEKLHPEVAEVHATLAAIYFKLREYEPAATEVREAQRLKPGLPRLDSLLGLSLSELGRFEEALPHLEKGFKQTADPDTRRMCGLQLLRAYTGLGRDADAVETALALNRFFPDDPEVLYHTGRIYGNFAYIVMEKLHDKAPDSVWMLQAQGEANESQKDYDAAIIAFNHLLQIDPNRPGIHYRLGRVHLARFRDSQKPEDRDAAAREFTAELAVDPGNGNAAYELAVMAQEQGNLDQARAQFEQVIRRFPDFEEALVGLGGVCLDSQKPEQGVAPLERATRINPYDEVAWYRLAQAERATGNREAQQKALAAFQRLHSSSPGALRNPNAADEITPQKLGAGAAP